MADNTIETVKITDLSENATLADSDLIPVGDAGTPILKKIKWLNFFSSLKSKLALKQHAQLDLIQNATTADTTRGVSAAVAKNLQDQLTQQNTNMKTLIWSYTVKTDMITVPSGGAVSYNQKAPDIGGYHAVGVLSIYHGDNNGQLLISKCFCLPDTGDYGACIKNVSSVQIQTNLFFVLLYVKDL